MNPEPTAANFSPRTTLSATDTGIGPVAAANATGGVTNAASAPAPLRRHELRIELTEDDRPEDRFSHHVNNARYFAFINRTFQSWYVPMGLRNRQTRHGAVMAHVSWDFVRQVFVPGSVCCRIEVVKVSRSSLEHTVELFDLAHEPPRLAGRGRVVHVCIERESGKASVWPAEVLSLCWSES